MYPMRRLVEARVRYLTVRSRSRHEDDRELATLNVPLQVLLQVHSVDVDDVCLQVRQREDE